MGDFIWVLKRFLLSTEACEGGCSQMNLIPAAEINRLATNNISGLLMIAINGTPLDYWNAKNMLYHGCKRALNKETGLSREKTDISKSS